MHKSVRSQKLKASPRLDGPKHRVVNNWERFLRLGALAGPDGCPGAISGSDPSRVAFIQLSTRSHSLHSRSRSHRPLPSPAPRPQAASPTPFRARPAAPIPPARSRTLERPHTTLARTTQSTRATVRTAPWRIARRISQTTRCRTSQ